MLQDFSSTISKTTNVVFCAISLAASLAPIYLYYGVHRMEIADSYFIWIAAVLGASYGLVQAYKNVKHSLKHQIVLKRGDAIAREINRQLADDKVISKKEKEERVLWKKNEIADYEAAGTIFVFSNYCFHATLTKTFDITHTVFKVFGTRFV